MHNKWMNVFNSKIEWKISKQKMMKKSEIIRLQIEADDEHAVDMELLV